MAPWVSPCTTALPRAMLAEAQWPGSTEMPFWEQGCGVSYGLKRWRQGKHAMHKSVCACKVYGTAAQILFGASTTNNLVTVMVLLSCLFGALPWHDGTKPPGSPTLWPAPLRWYPVSWVFCQTTAWKQTKPKCNTSETG